MSTYTDLHNRVQESINVDYNSRITPQKVIFANEENEYRGTFNGKVIADDLEVSNGTFTDVTIRNATLDGVNFENIDSGSLNLDLADYAKSADLNALSQEFYDNLNGQTELVSRVNTALSTMSNLAETIETTKSNLLDKVDTAVETSQQLLTSFGDNIDGKLEILESKLTVIDSALCDKIAEKDSVADRITAISEVQNNINVRLVTLSAEITSQMASADNNLHADDVYLSGAITAEISNRAAAIENEQHDRAADILAVNGRIGTEESNRASEITRVEGLVNTERTDRQTAVSNEAATRQQQDEILDGKIRDEVTDRIDADTALKNNLEEQIAQVSGDVITETYFRIENCNKLLSTMTDVSNALSTADYNLSTTLVDTSSAIDLTIQQTSAELISVIQHDRHYVLNADTDDYKTTDTYPLVAEDMAVNIYDMYLTNGKLTWRDPSNDKEIEIAQITIDNPGTPALSDIRFTVKTFDGIKNDSIVSAITLNTQYMFTYNQRENSTGKGYTLVWEPVPEFTSFDQATFTLKPDVVKYYQINYGADLIGKVYDAEVNGIGQIVSGRYQIDTIDPELTVFNKFNNIVFNTNEKKTTNIDGTEEITYDLSSRSFTMKRGIDNTPYISLVDEIEGHSNVEFARVLEHVGALSGVEIDENDEIQKIYIQQFDPKGDTFVCRNDNFRTIISSDIPNYSDGKTYNYYISAEVDGLSARIVTYKAAQLYKYAFTYNKMDGEDSTECTGYVTPIMYNYTINDGRTFLCAKVDLTDVPVFDPFKRVYILEKEPGKNEWSYSVTNDDGSYIIIRYNIVTLYISYATANEVEIVRHQYAVQTTPTPGQYDETESTTVVFHRSGLVDLSHFDQTAPIIGKTYTASIATNSTSIQAATYDLDIKTDGNDIIKIIVPDKPWYSLEDQISREFLVVSRFNVPGNQQKMVQVKFITSTGEDITFYNNKHRDLYLQTGSWTTLQLNEIRPNRFLVTDLNQNEDRFLFAQIRNALLSDEANIATLCTDLATEQTTQSTNASYLSGIIGELSGKHDTEASFLSGQITVLRDDAFILSDENVVSTTTIFEDVDLSCVDMSAATAISLSATNISADSLSATLLSANEMSATLLSANELSGTAVSAKALSATSLSANSLSGTMVSAYDLSATALSANALSVTNISAYDLSATMLSVNALSGADVSAESLSATSLSVNALSGTDVSVKNLTTDNLTGTDVSVQTLTDESACISALSADTISTDQLTGLAGNVSSLIVETANISTAYVDKLSVEELTSVSACISDLYVNALSTVVDKSTNINLQDTIDDIDERLDTVSVIVDDALSSNCYLPQHDMQNEAALSAIVSKLLIVDEVTYDVYALTMRNGALNVDKIGPWNTKHPHKHSADENS